MTTRSARDPERTRQAELDRLRILDTPTEPQFDDLARLAATVCAAPIALISLLDRDRQWFKAHIGLQTRETPRGYAFCEHAIRQPEQVTIVSDATQDERFAANPLVTAAPRIRFYAGAPLVSAGQALGTLCTIDSAPRRGLDAWQLDTLQFLAGQVVVRLEERRRALDPAWGPPV